MKYTVKNFKIFNEQGVTFDIAPITMLTGCNSSGKSSLVKSMMALGEYLAKVKSYLNTVSREKKLSALAQPIDFGAGVKDIGGFDNVLNEFNTNGQITFQYTVDSKLLMEEVTVTLVFVKDKKDVFHRNGLLQDVSFQRKDGTLFYRANAINLKHLLIDLSVLKDDFLKVALDSTLTILDKEISEKEREIEDSYEFLILPKDQRSEFKSALNEMKAKRQRMISSLPPDYRYSPVNQLSSELLKHITDLVKKKTFSEEDLLASYKYKTTFYLPLLKMLDGVKKDQTRQVINTTLQNTKLTLTPEEQIDLDFILEDFEKSKFGNFNDYYCNFEDLCLRFSREDKDTASTSSTLSSLEDLFWGIDDINSATSVAKVNYSNKGVLLPHEYEESDQPSQNPPCKVVLSMLYSVLSDLCFEIDSSFCNKEVSEMGLDYRNDIYALFQNYFVSLWEELLVDAIPVCLSNLQYVGSTRATAQRLYSFDNNDSDLNPIITEYLSSKRIFGDVFAGFKKNAMLNAKFDMKKSKEELVQYEEELNRVFDRDNSFMARWLNKLGLCDSFSVDPVTVNGVSLGYSITFTKNGKTHSIADEGYGCIQLFSVLMVVQNAINLHDIGVIKDSLDVIYTIAVEEPENHLHPKLQSLLADMFLEAKEIADIQFLIETHSEYLIRKSQVLVKKWYEENKETDKSCPFQAYYIPSGGTPFSLGYRKDGKFSESFGPGFYDESANLTFEIM